MSKLQFWLGIMAVACSATFNEDLYADNINPAFEYSSTSIVGDSRPFTLGYQFSTSTSLNINALAYWVDGLANNHEVGIWDSVGTLLVSTTVLSTDPIVGHFQYDAVSVVLGPGTYTIGGEYLGDNDPFPFFASGVTNIPEVTYITDEQAFGAGLHYPTVSTSGFYGDNGIFAVDFSVTSSAVPEPSSVALLGVGGLGMAVAAYRRRRHAA